MNNVSNFLIPKKSIFTKTLFSLSSQTIDSESEEGLN